MKFTIQVNEGPYTHQASDSAYLFTKAALEKGHEIFRIFFYHDGVNNATRLTTPPQDDRNIVNRWSELAEQHDLDMVVCVAAAQRRGIADEGREFEIERALRKMHVFNPIPSQFGSWPGGQRSRSIPIEHIIEDPAFKPSSRSYFIQLADCVAHALLKRETATTPRVLKYGIHKMFDDNLAGVCFKPASSSDPLGVVRK